MPLALILSSHVSASRVGGQAQALALSPFGVDPVLVPTVLFGRHPGWGPPGGAPVDAVTFGGVLEGIEANGLFGLTDLILSGYYASPEQVAAAARAIDAVRAAPRGRAYSSKATVIVDPTIGDAGKGLYVSQAVADAIQAHLLPRADIIRCNASELGHITGQGAGDPGAAVRAARALNRPAVVSSIDCGEDIGVICVDQGEAWLAAHPRAATAPKGTGDLLTALLGAALIEGLTLFDATARAVGGVAETVLAAQAWTSPELPIVSMGARIKAGSPTVRMERLA
jgi:pyridoxine kinase